MITIKQLEKNYGKATPLKDVNAEIKKGDVISIIGPSGTGKSTLLRCINLLEKPTAGQIFIDGEEITASGADVLSIRRKLGMVFQSFNLFSHKMVIENVMMGPMDLQGVKKQEAFDEAAAYLKRVGLGEKLYAYPDELSGGQKQRAAIARCLIMKPEIILFDEPTSALDPVMVGEVQGVIRDLADQGLTMMIVTHDMKFSREVSNRIFYMDEGIIYEDGTPEEIFDHPKKEKTRAFIKRLSTMEYRIQSKDFDLYQMNAQMEDFGRRHFWTEKQIKNGELILEELIINQILPYSQDILVQVRYFEAEHQAQLHLIYEGNSYDPFHTDEEDQLSMLIVRQMTDQVQYEYDGQNLLTMNIRS